MEEKMRSLFAEFSIGQLSNPRKSQHRKTLDLRDDPQEHGHITSDLNNPCMKVDFPRWKEGDSIGWISHAERYFRFYRTADATQVEIAAIHLKGDAIRWFISLCTPIEDSLTGDPRRSNGAAIVHSYGDDFLCAYPGRTIEPQDDDSAQVLPTVTQADEKLKTQFPEFMELQP
ncbi:hypothetical protein B296_00011107 [Ensete ventricosum]|uniref:Retrotransposon gag domain-containing protein n=1 Tax=Ensete ventricosum TaxID=4639 RepID=A0A426XEZ2_ENSVE|nr:hypothetical protein B296_00011107 [Ensete ventricosum]